MGFNEMGYWSFGLEGSKTDQACRVTRPSSWKGHGTGYFEGWQLNALDMKCPLFRAIKEGEQYQPSRNAIPES